VTDEDRHKMITALLPHKNHGSYFRENCPHCKAGAEIERIQAVVDAAVLFCHHDMAAHHGTNEYHRKKSRKNLFDEVAAYEEHEQDS